MMNNGGRREILWIAGRFWKPWTVFRKSLGKSDAAVI